MKKRIAELEKARSRSPRRGSQSKQSAQLAASRPFGSRSRRQRRQGKQQQEGERRGKIQFVLSARLEQQPDEEFSVSHEASHRVQEPVLRAVSQGRDVFPLPKGSVQELTELVQVRTYLCCMRWIQAVR